MNLRLLVFLGIGSWCISFDCMAQSFALDSHTSLGSENANSVYLSRNLIPSADEGMFVVGVFPDSVILGNDTLRTDNTDAVYLARLASDLTVMWSRKIVENQVNVGTYHMTSAATSDQEGNIILGISYTDELFFFGDSAGQVGGVAVELLKLGQNGDTIWCKHIEGVKLGGQGVTTNSQGEIYVTGQASEDVLIAKYSSAGELVWSRTAGGSSGLDQGYAIEVDALSNVYVLGLLYPLSSVYFDSLQPPMPSGAYNVSFVSKYDPNGAIQWVRMVYSTLWAYSSLFKALECDANGNVILAGQYADAILRFSNGFSSVGPQPGGYPLAFLTSFDSNGNRLWVTTSPYSDTGHDEAVDLELFGSTALVLNSFYGTVASVNGSMDNYGFDDLRLQAFDLSGALLSDLQIGGAFLDHGNQLLVANDRVFALGCTFSHPLHVGPDEFDHPNQGNTFVIELGQDPDAVPQYVGAGSVRVFPNPTSGAVTLSLEHLPIDAHFIVRDPLGREVLQRSVRDRYTTLTLPFSGFYLLELWEQGARVAVQRVVVD